MAPTVEILSVIPDTYHHTGVTNGARLPPTNEALGTVRRGPWAGGIRIGACVLR